MQLPTSLRPIRSSLRLRTSAKSKPSQPQTVYLELRQGANRKRISTGVCVIPKAWDAKGQRVKVIADQLDAASLNDTLREWSTAANEVQRDLKRDNKPVTVEAIVDSLQDVVATQKTKQDHTAPNEFIAFWRNRMRNGVDLKTGKPLSEGTRKTYLVELNRILAFDSKVTFEKITISWYRGLVAYHRKRGLTDGSIGRCISKLKAVLKDAEEQGQTVPRDYTLSAFKAYPSAPDKVALTKDQLEALQAAPNLTDSEQLAVCWFMLMARTGLRYGDAIALTPDNYVKQSNGAMQLHVLAQKTSNKKTTKCCIPASASVLAALPPEHPERWPQKMANQKINQHIKAAAIKAGLDELIGFDNKEPTPLYEWISCHTARRTFATILYRQNIPIDHIRTATGHSSEAALRRYLKLAPQERASELAELANFNW